MPGTTQLYATLSIGCICIIAAVAQPQRPAWIVNDSETLTVDHDGIRFRRPDGAVRVIPPSHVTAMYLRALRARSNRVDSVIHAIKTAHEHCGYDEDCMNDLAAPLLPILLLMKHAVVDIDITYHDPNSYRSYDEWARARCKARDFPTLMTALEQQTRKPIESAEEWMAETLKERRGSALRLTVDRPVGPMKERVFIRPGLYDVVIFQPKAQQSAGVGNKTDGIIAVLGPDDALSSVVWGLVTIERHPTGNSVPISDRPARISWGTNQYGTTCAPEPKYREAQCANCSTCAVIETGFVKLWVITAALRKGLDKYNIHQIRKIAGLP